MSLWDKIINQNKLDSSLIVELSDISYRSTKGRRERPRGTKEDMVNLGTMPCLKRHHHRQKLLVK